MPLVILAESTGSAAGAVFILLLLMGLFVVLPIVLGALYSRVSPTNEPPPIYQPPHPRPRNRPPRRRPPSQHEIYAQGSSVRSAPPSSFIPENQLKLDENNKKRKPRKSKKKKVVKKLG